MAKKTDNNFSKKMKKLQEIVDELEKEELDLDKSLSLYKEGIELSNTLQNELKSYEKQIVELNGENDD